MKYTYDIDNSFKRLRIFFRKNGGQTNFEVFFIQEFSKTSSINCVIKENSRWKRFKGASVVDKLSIHFYWTSWSFDTECVFNFETEAINDWKWCYSIQYSSRSSWLPPPLPAPLPPLLKSNYFNSFKRITRQRACIHRPKRTRIIRSIKMFG